MSGKNSFSKRDLTNIIAFYGWIRTHDI